MSEIGSVMEATGLPFETVRTLTPAEVEALMDGASFVRRAREAHDAQRRRALGEGDG